jgi:hypothetical protein
MRGFFYPVQNPQGEKTSPGKIHLSSVKKKRYYKNPY